MPQSRFLDALSRDLEHGPDARFSRESLQTLSITWGVFMLLVAVNCYLHGLLIVDQPHPFLLSLGWAGSYWTSWAVLSPFILRQAPDLLDGAMTPKRIAIQVGLATLLSLLALAGYVLFSWASGVYASASRAAAMAGNLLFSKLWQGWLVYALLLGTGVLLVWAKRRHDARLAASREPVHSVIASRGTVQVLVQLDDIACITAAGNYLELHGKGGEQYLRRQTMKSFEISLDPSKFVRIHRSAIVAKTCIAAIAPRSCGDYLVTLHNGKELLISKSYRSVLKRLDSNPFGMAA